MRILSSILAVFLLSANALGQAMNHDGDAGKMQTGSGEMGFFSPAEVKWIDGPASLPPGVKYAVLVGDPAKEGFFTMRLWMPDGYRVQPHWHPKTEHVTIISGTLNIGMGEKFDQSATRALTAGTFGFWAAGMRHFAWAKGETVLQLNGIGPWMITYVNPADDPRQAKKE